MRIRESAPRPVGTAAARAPRLAFVAAVAGLVVAVGCAPRTGSAPPAQNRSAARPAAELCGVALARPLIAALFGPANPTRTSPARIGTDADAVFAMLAPSVAADLGASNVEAMLTRIRSRYAPPSALVEERLHREGPLRWYDGLYEAPPLDRAAKGPVPYLLVQAAFDADGQIRRLLVREHYLPEQLAHPARNYRPVNRFLFVSKGEWTVLHGGPTRATNYHHGSRTQRWAYDLVVRRGGRVHPPGRKRNRDHYCYGLPVLASAPGVVVRAVDGVPENVPGRKGRGGGNGVVIDHGFGEFSSSWHGIPGSVRVKVGDRVEPGQPLFRVGNSGASTLPHIHFHVWAGRLSQPFGLPAPFSDVYVDRRYFAERMPLRGDRVMRADVDLRLLGPPSSKAPDPTPVVWLDLGTDTAERG